jgi:hypothetical protein
MIYYAFTTDVGLDTVSANGDGSTINVKWNQAYSSNKTQSNSEYIDLEVENLVNIDGYYYLTSNVNYELQNDNIVESTFSSTLEGSLNARNGVITFLSGTRLNDNTGNLTSKVKYDYYCSTKKNVAYHIYYSKDKDLVFSEGVKFISLDGSVSADIIDLDPGQLYYFCVRPVEYDPILVDIDNLTTAFGNLKIYSESLLRENISATSLVIPLIDASTFPNYGIVKIGVELIKYLYVDRDNNNLILSDVSDRGFLDTEARSHRIDGYDGYDFWSPTISFSLGREELIFDRIYACQSRTDINNYSFNLTDGYKQITKDLLTSDLSGSDAYNENFNSYDYDGWHRTDPVKLLKGECVGSYLGGEQFCADGYGGVGRMIRGVPLQERILQRQEMLLSMTGEPVVLLRRERTGIICKCVLPTSEYPDDRCPYCLGGKFVLSYKQYFNPRRSDGRIMVRFSPSDEDVKMQDAGLESELTTDCWTLTVPTIKDRDILVRFDQDNNEEFRYEVLSVNRNRTVLQLESAQKIKVQRIRKFDKYYQIKVFRDTSTLPEKVQTSITNAIGIGPHKHEIVTSNKPVYQFNQLSSVNQGHNHEVVWDSSEQKLKVLEVLGHTHEILL